MAKKQTGAATPRYSIERLNEAHQVKEFDCGEIAMNTFLAIHARRNQDEDFGVTHVLVASGSTRVLGYYTLVSAHLDREEALSFREQSELPPLNVPIVRMGRLAVDNAEQSKGLGKFLLIDALLKALEWSDDIGARGVDVHAINEAAVEFYRRYGFERLPDADDHLFIAMETIRRLNNP